MTGIKTSLLSEGAISASWARCEQQHLMVRNAERPNTMRLQSSAVVLKAENEKVSRKRVARLMRENDLVARCVKAFNRSTIRDPNLPVSRNFLQQDFSAAAADKRWDILKYFIIARRVTLIQVECLH